MLVAFAAGCTTSMRPEAVLSVPAAPQKYASLVVDARTGKQIFEMNSSAPRHPASLTKMMTLYMLFEALEAGRVEKNAEIPVSSYAASRPPSRLGLRAGEHIDVDTAIRALAVRSANDVAAAVGEYLAGSEDGFAVAMTAKARQLGMKNTTFRNASGLPDENQLTTARDMAVLAIALRNHFPQYYHYFSSTNFMFRGKLVRGHNDMLGRVRGVDGLKTGYIRASGFNIVTSYSADGRRYIVVVMGANTARERNAHAEALLEQALSSSASRTRVTLH
ncbi:D-alanyl-D-alanine carboxypeptidase family protein [Aquamicrobium segne]|uniref:D-alanyl-D-alanine carboxypeptidase family protein n=1 Tax=Aquamicrobium segne TaxID=469547 RepID=A0ABW0H1I9_9HYPH